MQIIFQKVSQGIPHWFGTPDGFRSYRIPQDPQAPWGFLQSLRTFRIPHF